MYIVLQLQVALTIMTKVHTVKGTNIYTLLQFPQEKTLRSDKHFLYSAPTT